MIPEGRSRADKPVSRAVADEALWPVIEAIGLGFAACTIVVDDDDDAQAVDYRFDAVNTHFTAMTGLVDPVGRTALELVPGLERVWVETYARVGLGRETLQFEQGSEVMGRWFDVSATPLPEYGRFAIVFTDQTARRRAQEAVRRRDDDIRQIADELPVMVWLTDAKGVFAFVNQTFSEYFGATRTTVTHPDWRLPTHPDDGDAHLADFFRAVEAGDDFATCVRVRRADGEWRSVETWGRPRFDAAGDYLGHVGGAVDVTERVEAEGQREALLQRERDARLKAEILERHAVALAVCSTREEIAHAVLDRIEEAFELTVTAVNLVEGGHIAVFAGRDANQEQVAAHQGVAVSADLPGPFAIATNEPLLLNSSTDIEQRFPHLADVAAGYGIDTLLALPIRGLRRNALGALVVGRGGEHAFTLSDLALLHDLAEKTGVSLDRAELFDSLVTAHEQQRTVAIRLQESLLPDAVVAHPAIELEARYRAADDAMQVGGDWYDTAAWDSGHVAVMVGDVVGHDLEAAARMGRLRAAVAAVIPSGPPDPVAILQALDRCACGPDGVEFVTAAAAVLDMATGELAYCTAGHPPPLVVRQGGTVEVLGDGGVPPLGCALTITWPTAATTTQLGAHDTVVVYSDGLVERRDHAITDGIDELRRRCGAWRPNGSVELVDELIRDADAGDDDVVVVTLRWLGSR